MGAVAVTVPFTSEDAQRWLRDNQLGDLVGLRAQVVNAPDNPVLMGFFIAGTVGYIETTPDGSPFLSGVWRPVEAW
jgi:hypothetical protein